MAQTKIGVTVCNIQMNRGKQEVDSLVWSRVKWGAIISWVRKRSGPPRQPRFPDHTSYAWYRRARLWVLKRYCALRPLSKGNRMHMSRDVDLQSFLIQLQIVIPISDNHRKLSLFGFQRGLTTESWRPSESVIAEKEKRFAEDGQRIPRTVNRRPYPGDGALSETALSSDSTIGACFLGAPRRDLRPIGTIRQQRINKRTMAQHRQ